MLIHEMGHALEARRAGARPEVTLVWFGGVTRFMPTMSVARRLWISSAGVVYQFVTAGLVWMAVGRGWLEGLHPAAEPAARAFVIYNVFLAVINLVPLGGMDGGAILQHLLELLGVSRPRTVVWVVYGVGGAGLAAWGFGRGHTMLGLVGLYLTFSGLSSQTRQVRYERDATGNPEIERRLH